MRNNRIKIDLLTVILLISIASLYSFSNRIKDSLKGKSPIFKKFENLGDLAHIPDDIDRKLYLFDPYFNMQYSSNGGDSFTEIDSLSADDVRLSNLSRYITSYRSKPVDGIQPELKSVLVKTENKKSGIYSESQMVSFLGNLSHRLPVLSLVTSEKGLFSEIEGVMVLGKDAWFAGNDYYLPFWERNANYKRRGEASKRKANWQLIIDNKVVYQAQSDLQISGNATRSFPQKSLKLKAHKFYDMETFNYRFFGKKGLKRYQSLVIRNSGNDNVKTLFADLLMHNLARKSNVLTQRGKPIVVYINGYYWGIYNLRERIDIYMIANKVDAKFEEITVLEGGSGLLKDGDAEEWKRFNKMIESLKMKTVQITYEDILREIDVNSFIDYIFFETFFGNGDWLNNNALWYNVSGGQWKWILNDLDYGLTYLGEDNINKNYFKDLKRSQSANASLFNYLITNDDFRLMFKTRSQQLIENLLSEKKIKKSVKKLKAKIASELFNHLKRWNGNLTMEKWETNVEANLNFLLNRRTIYKLQIENI